MKKYFKDSRAVYATPEIELIDLAAEGMICQSSTTDDIPDFTVEPGNWS